MFSNSFMPLLRLLGDRASVLPSGLLLGRLVYFLRRHRCRVSIGISGYRYKKMGGESDSVNGDRIRMHVHQCGERRVSRTKP